MSTNNSSMRLNWMQQRNTNTNNEAKHIKNMKLDSTENNKNPEQLQGFVLQQKRSRETSEKINLKEGVKMKQQRGRPISIQYQAHVAKELKRLIVHEFLEKPTELTEDSFVSPQWKQWNKQTRETAMDLWKLQTVS